MITDDETQMRLIDWLATVTGVAVIAAYQSGPTPDGRYVVVNYISSESVRQFPQGVEFTDSQVTPIIEREWVYSIHAYGNSPSDVLRPIVSARHVNQAQEPLWPYLRIHELSMMRNIPDFINSEWRPRAQMDLTLRGMTKDGFIVDTINDISWNIDRKEA